MADNVNITPGTGAIVATEDVGAGVEVQRVKLITGALHTDGGDVTIANPFPVQMLAALVALTTQAWTSATALDSTKQVTVTGYNSVIITQRATTTITGGVITFEVSDDGTVWYPIVAIRTNAFTIDLTYALSTTSVSWQVNASGWNFFRVRLSTVITGTGTVTIGLSVSAGNLEAETTVGQTDATKLNATIVEAGTATSSGILTDGFVGAASNNARSTKASAGQLYGCTGFNTSGVPIYVKFYNKASSPAPATDNALLKKRLGVQAGQPLDFHPKVPIPFSTGIALAVVRGITDTDNTSTALSDFTLDVEYV